MPWKSRVLKGPVFRSRLNGKNLARRCTARQNRKGLVMAITFDRESRIFTLDTKDSTWQMQVSPYGHLLHLYYGGRVFGAGLSYLVRGINRGFSGAPYEVGEAREYSLDTYPQEFSTFGVGDYRASCLQVEHGDGSRATELLFDSYRIYKGKYGLSGLPAVWAQDGEGETLEIVLKDKATRVEVVLYYGVLESYDVITRACQVKNKGEGVWLNRVLSACLDFQRDDLEMISFYGRHAMERMLERGKCRHGKVAVDSLRGTSSHQQNPFVILCEDGARESWGECYGASLVYSGNFLAQAEVDQIGQARFVMGIHPEGFCWRLEKGESFTAPEVVFSFSREGYGKLSRNFHNLYRRHLTKSKFRGRRRPVLLNNWEATTFYFTQDELVSLAESGKELGVELFVMDDGWFGGRNHDRCGLGDWTANREKLPAGVEGLAEKIHGMGLQFGIWIEPEMVNEDSGLYRAHPDWCLCIPGRTPNRERGQLVLDMSRQEVRDYLFAGIGEVLEKAKVDYVKWDMNRNLSDVWSASYGAGRQGEVAHRYVLGVYELMERFTNRFPDILWEGCSGGGGRFDAGILYYMPQIWCSDNTDAIERIAIQYGTSFGYPASAMGAHVSVSPNQQTGREVPLQTRGVVAMAGAFGYELDVRKLSPQEREAIKGQIWWYKQWQPLILDGDYYRLTAVEENGDFAAWQFVSQDQKRSLVSAVCLRARANPPFLRVRAKGLLEDVRYRVWYRGEGEGAPEDGKGNSLEGQGMEMVGCRPMVCPGSALMNAGVNLPVFRKDYESVEIVIEAF